MSGLAKRLLSGERFALSRVISKCENRNEECPKILSELYAHTGRAQVWGVTGPPGAGKSTLVDQVIRTLRSKNKSVAVVAVDPSSPFSGGAILGDRIRMQDHVSDPQVFIRSLGTRGKQGGLSQATFETVMALDAAGFDHILVETAGVGQTELEILEIAHQVVVVLVPESGDSIQMMKAGLLEIADLFVINKSDRPEAGQLQKHLEGSLDLIPSLKKRPQVFLAQAVRGIGIDEIVQSLLESRSQSQEDRELKNQSALKRAVFQILAERLQHSVEGAFQTSSGRELLEKMTHREMDPYSAADLISRV